MVGTLKSHSKKGGKAHKGKVASKKSSPRSRSRSKSAKRGGAKKKVSKKC
jgi:hypothetical protein